MLLAFHGDKTIKAKYLNRVRLHARADEIVHGYYWERGKGCAVGCTVHSGSHVSYETELGIPQMLARLEDRLFEGQANGNAKIFPMRFLSAIKPGADLSRVGWQFLHWLLTEELAGRDYPLVRDAVKQCANVLVPLTKGEPVNKSAASAARSAAWSAESAAASAAWSATRGAAWSAAASAESAASAARSAASAASAARSAAWSAAASAESAAASAACGRMSDKLLKLLAAAPRPKKARKAA